MEKTITKPNTVADCKTYNAYPWSVQSTVQPLEITHAKGSFFYDASGKKWLDFSSQLVNMNMGHGHAQILQAMKDQMDQFAFIFPGSASDVKAKLSKKLIEIAPDNMRKVFYTLSGAEANENALKIARMVTGKHKILTHKKSYHGATYGALSCSGDPRNHPITGAKMPGVVHFDNPYFYRCPWDTQTPEQCGEKALENLENTILAEGPTQIAAILIEGESGTSGCLKYPSNYWKGVIALAKKYDILTIADEVISGFGRTGEWFGVQYHQVEPDMITCAKGITAGYFPLGAVIMSEKVATYFDHKPFPFGLTNNAQPIGLAAALATINAMENEGILEQSKGKGQYLKARLESLKEVHPSIGDVRTTGMLCCLELVKDQKTKTPMAPFNATADQMEVMNQVHQELKNQGIFTLVRWNWIFICPPLNMSVEELDQGLEAIDHALNIADQAIK